MITLKIIYMVPMNCHCMENSCAMILQKSYFCVPQEKQQQQHMDWNDITVIKYVRFQFLLLF